MLKRVLSLRERGLLLLRQMLYGATLTAIVFGVLREHREESVWSVTGLRLQLHVRVVRKLSHGRRGLNG